jgi:DNA-binding MarR family transcriptional regulator
MNGDERLLMAVVRTAERFKKQVSAYLKKYGLSFSQYNLLRVLDASEEGRNTMKLVNKIMLVSGANLTGITKRLEKTGCITRTTDSEDERSKWLEITDKGKQLVGRIAEEHERMVKKYLESASEEKKAEMLDVLREIIRKL